MRTIKIIIAVAGIVLASACTKDNGYTPADQGGLVVTIPGGVKTTLGGDLGNEVFWSGNDALAVRDADKNTKQYILTSGAGTKTAAFVCQEGDFTSGQLNVFYPHDVFVYSDKDNRACNVAPRQSAGKKWNNSYFAYNLVMQVQGENISNGKILLMKGTKDASVSGPIKMEQIMGILRVKFKSDAAKEAAKNDGVKYILVEIPIPNSYGALPVGVSEDTQTRSFGEKKDGWYLYSQVGHFIYGIRGNREGDYQNCAQYISYEIKDFNADYFDIVVPPISESGIYLVNALELSEWSGAVIDADEALAGYDAKFPISAGKIETAVLKYPQE